MNKGLILSIIAGFTTLSGMLFTINFKNKKYNEKIVTIALSMAFIVMIMVSIFDLFPESLKNLQNKPFLAIFLYILIIYTIIYIILNKSPKNKKKIVEKGELYYLGIYNMIALLLHNIPEGVITYITDILCNKIKKKIFYIYIYSIFRRSFWKFTPPTFI